MLKLDAHLHPRKESVLMDHRNS